MSARKPAAAKVARQPAGKTAKRAPKPVPPAKPVAPPKPAVAAAPPGAAQDASAAALALAGGSYLPLADRSRVSSTDVMVSASGLLKAANLAVFELGMWQSWTGR
jgi:hypothetical protein